MRKYPTVLLFAGEKEINTDRIFSLVAGNLNNVFVAIREIKLLQNGVKLLRGNKQGLFF